MLCPIDDIMSVTEVYDIHLLLSAASTPSRNHTVYASFFDDDVSPTTLYCLNDIGNVRDSVRLSVFDLETGTVTSTGTLITTTTDGANWDDGAEFSGCYCSYNNTIFCSLPEKVVLWDDPTATVLETSFREGRFSTKTFPSEPQYVYVFSADATTTYIKKWDLATNLAVSEITQPWTPTSPIMWMEYLEDGTAWIRSKIGDIYKGTWDKSGTMTASSDYVLIYTNAGTLGTTSSMIYNPFRYVPSKDILVMSDMPSISSDVGLYDYDVVGNSLTLTHTIAASPNRWVSVNVDSTRGYVHFDSIWGGEILDYPTVFFAPLLSVTPGVLSAMVAWPAVDLATAYRITYTPSGGSETTSISSTPDLLGTVNGLAAETVYDFNLYSSVDGTVFTLVITISESTSANVAANYDITEFGSTGSYDLSTLTATSLASISSVLNDLFVTDDKISVAVNGKTTVAKFIKTGETSTIEDSTAVILPFDALNGASQTLNFTYSNATTEAVDYDDVGETIEIEGVVYSPGDSFVLDGRKSTIVEL